MFCNFFITYYNTNATYSINLKSALANQGTLNDWVISAAPPTNTDTAQLKTLIQRFIRKNKHSLKSEKSK